MASRECAHSGCACSVPDGRQFCSEHCERQAGVSGGKDPESGCRCGHDACDGAGRVAHG